MAQETTTGDIILSDSDVENLREGESVSVTGLMQPSKILPPCSLSGHEWRYNVPREGGEAFLERRCSNCSTVEVADITFDRLGWD